MHFYKGSENDMKVAILEADKILNEALRAAGMPGIQLGDRFKRARAARSPTSTISGRRTNCATR